MLKRLRHHAPLIPVLLVLAGLILLLRQTQPYRTVEYRTLDWRFKRFSDPSRAHKGVVLAMLDQKTLDHFEEEMDLSWPLPREVYAALLELCRAGGARTIIFDILFTNPSRDGEEDDEAFAEGLSSAPKPLLAMQLSKNKKIHENKELQQKFAAAPPDRFALRLEKGGDRKLSGRIPTGTLLKAAHMLGDVTAEPDEDGIYRRVPLLSRMGKHVYPTMSLAAAMAASGESELELEDGSLRLGKRSIPLIDGRMLVRFHGNSLTGPERERPFKAYSLGNLILSGAALREGETPAIDPAELKDKIVFVGYSASGLLDIRPSPISPIFAGTEILAAATDNILQEDFLVPAGASTTVAIAFAAILLGAVITLLRPIGLSIGALLGVSALLVLAAASAFKRDVWLDMTAPQLALFLGFAASSAYNYVVEGRKKKFIQGAFGRYLSPKVVKQIVDDPERLALGGEKADISVFFSDIAGFTTISEKLDPQSLVKLLNAYLGAMTDIILGLEGTLDKYEGDAIMAFWGAPIRQEDHAVRACRAALENQRKLTSMQDELKKIGGSEVAVRIGLNSGPASVGNMGSARRFDYTALGDNVNLASRLEGANKAYGTRIMIAESVRERAGEMIETRELDLLRVKGKNKPIRVFELLGMRYETPEEILRRRELFEKGLGLYRDRKWREAEKAFKAVIEEFPDDGPAGVYVKRCESYGADPPGPDWDGVCTLTEK